eukprot:g13644.t1
MEKIGGDGTAVKAVQRATKLIKNSRQISHDDTAAKRDLDRTIDETSGRVLAWAEGVAAAAAAEAAAAAVSGGEDQDQDRQRQLLPSALLASCCRYMEALATTAPARFSAECQSLAMPVASCAQQLMMAHGTGAAVSGRAIADGEADIKKENQSVAAESSSPPPPPVAVSGPGSSPAPSEEEEIAAESEDGRNNDCGAAQLPAAAAASGRTSLAIEERRAMELWVDMLGICLLPFCSAGGGAAPAGQGGPSTAGESEQFDDPLESDSEDEDYEDADGGDDEGNSGGGGGGLPGGGRRAGWVAGWMQRAGVSLAKPLECPFDVKPRGRDEELPFQLAVLAASHAKAAASASRPASVSSLATALAVLVAFTAHAGNAAGEEEGQVSGRSGGHGAVVEEALSCLVSLSETPPESSAQAECVKVALVALKDCVQAARLECLEGRATALLLMLEGVSSRLKPLLARSKSRGPKAYSTARSFCREALAAAVACARELIGRAGAAAVADDPQWFLGTLVVKLTSPMLLGDAVGALRAAAGASAVACSAGAGTAAEVRGAGTERSEEAAREGIGATLRDVVLPGAVQRLMKALGSVERYSATAAKEVLKATAWLVRAAGGEVLPYRHRLGMALVECATSERRSDGGGGGGVDRDEKLRLCLRAIRRLGAATADSPGAASAASAAAACHSPAAENLEDGIPDAPSELGARSFAEAALDFTCVVIEREWLGKRGEQGGVGSQSEGGDKEESIIVLVEAHVTLVALLRSPSMRVPGVGPGGEWPAAAKRLAKLAWAVAYRVRKAAGAVESSMALSDDDVMLLCQGLEVLEALAECSGDFFEGHEKLIFFSGDLSPVLMTLRGCRDKNNMHPVVYDASAGAAVSGSPLVVSSLVGLALLELEEESFSSKFSSTTTLVLTLVVAAKEQDKAGRGGGEVVVRIQLH